MQIHSCTDTQQLQIQILFPAASDTLHNPPARDVDAGRGSDSDGNKCDTSQWVRFIYALIFSTLPFSFIFLSQLFHFTFCFVPLPCIDSPVSPVSLSRLSHVLFINLAKNAARIRPVAAIFQFENFLKVAARVRLGALSKKNCVENRLPRFSCTRKKHFRAYVGCILGPRQREREWERVRSPCAPCTLCQSIPLTLAAALSLYAALPAFSLSLSVLSSANIYCLQIAQKSVSPGQLLISGLFCSTVQCRSSLQRQRHRLYNTFDNHLSRYFIFFCIYFPFYLWSQYGRAGCL